MQRLGKNLGGYLGETIDIRRVLAEMESSAGRHGWDCEIIHQIADFKYLALHRAPLAASAAVPNGAAARGPRVYLSAGIHGDEPAGPLAALQLLQENQWPPQCELWFCPCLNPAGFALNRRENPHGQDLNRDYRHLNSPEVRAHVEWLTRQESFDVTFCLHEDWEANGFYLYELNPDERPSLARTIIEAVAHVCPIDLSPVIEKRPAEGGLISPKLDPSNRPEWPEAFWLLEKKTRLTYTLEAPSDFPLQTRARALVSGINAALGKS